MPPPELARDTPIFDIFQPVEIDLLEPFGHDPHLAIAHGGNRQLGERLGADKPLLGEERLDHLATALANADIHLVRLGLNQQAFTFEIGQNRLATLEAIQPGVGAARLVDGRIGIHNIDHRQMVALADFIVILVVAGVILTAPEPNSGSTYSSVIIGMGRASAGKIASLPTRWA